MGGVVVHDSLLSSASSDGFTYLLLSHILISRFSSDG